MHERRGKPRNWKEKLNYHLDNILTRNPLYQLLALFVVFWIVIALGTLGYYLTGGMFHEHPEFGLWHAILKTFDPGTMVLDTEGAQPEHVYPVPVRIVSVLMGFGGLLFLGSVLSIFHAGVHHKLHEIRKGRTRVFEKDHMIILGWSNKIYSIIQEVIYANDEGKPETLVLLSELDKEVMEDRIHERFPDLPKWFKIVCRTGQSNIPEDLSHLNIARAKAIITISDETNRLNIEYGDARVIKTLLAIHQDEHIADMSKTMPMVVEVEKPETVEIAQLAARGNAKVILRPDIISKIMVQTARHSGVADIYSHLLSFEGDEIYVHKPKTLVAKPFADTLYGFRGQIPIGLISGNGHGPKVMINPPHDLKIKENDSVILISETGQITESAPTKKPVVPRDVKFFDRDPRKPEHLLILGFSRELYLILREYDKYVMKGSSIQVVSDLPKAKAKELFARHVPDLKKCKFHYHEANRILRQDLENLKLDTFNSIMVLSDWKEGETFEVADARAIMSLLLIRDILAQAGKQNKTRIVSEILDPNNFQITRVTRVNDIIISNELMSRLLIQVAKQPEMLHIYEALFAEEGSEIYLKPMPLFNPSLKPASFRQLMAAAHVRNEIAIGLRKVNGHDSPAILLNPKEIDHPMVFKPEDRLIVLAENEAE